MINLKKHLDLLGLNVKDRITGFQGVVSSVCFDLYGCIQAVVNPGCDNDGKTQDCVWFDVGRLKILDPTPVMPRPQFDFDNPATVAEGKKGPSEKPSFNKA